MKRHPLFYTIAAILFSAGIVVTMESCRNRKPVAEKKPVIYLYPESEMRVDVRLTLHEEMSFTATDPAYNGLWSVIAKPGGELTNIADGKKYPYLFWEALDYHEFRFEQGFCVRGDSTKEFLDKTLTQIGLNEHEKNEFIAFWLPEMQGNAFNLITFPGEEYTSRAQLSVTPEPDALLRVFMVFKRTDARTEIKAQEFHEFVRKGFTVVEWGGANAGVPIPIN